MLLVPHYTHAVCALVLQKVLSDLVVGSAWQARLYCSARLCWGVKCT